MTDVTDLQSTAVGMLYVTVAWCSVSFFYCHWLCLYTVAFFLTSISGVYTRCVYSELIVPSYV